MSKRRAAPPSRETSETSRPARRIAARVLRPLERFLHVEAAGGIVLLVAAAVALAWANSPWSSSYELVWRAPVTFGIGRLSSTESVQFWINDGLMVIFFFVVGLEIRRELHDGELSDLRRAALPVAAAVGGMITPALLFSCFNVGLPSQRGWGIPMATDIAFAVGVLSVLGKRVSPALRTLLLALAIIDDIGAILVIAFFYSSGISLRGLAVVGAGIVGVLSLQRLGVRRALVYVLPGVVIWFGFLKAGVHPTLAGVVLGLLTPATLWPGEESASPLVVRLESLLHPWVAFLIMPLFALANAGVSFQSSGFTSAGAMPVFLGVVLGLVVGKPLGVLLLSFVAVRLGLCVLPTGVSWRGFSVVGLVAGVGFTMAIFIADLAFSRDALLPITKLAILSASLIAGIFAVLAGRVLLPPSAGPNGPAKEDRSDDGAGGRAEESTRR